MPKPYQAVIFDMDGLIVDTENIYYNTYNQTLNELGIDIPREEYVRCVGHPVESNSEDAVRRYNLPIRPEDFHEAWITRSENAISNPDQIDLMPGFLDCYHTFKQTLQTRHCIIHAAPAHANDPSKRRLAPHQCQRAPRHIWGYFFGQRRYPHQTRPGNLPQNRRKTSMSRPKPVSYLKTAKQAYNPEKPPA